MADDIIPESSLLGDDRPEDAVSITTLDGDWVRVRDCLCRSQKALELNNHRGLEPTSPEEFPYPVDMAVETEATGVRIDREVILEVVGQDGVNKSSIDDSESFSEDEQYFVSSQVGVRVYIAISGPLHINVDSNPEQARIIYEGDSESEYRRVAIGIRSDHKLPPGTVTTPAEPEALMQAISTFGPSMDLTTPQRSFPSLRSRPPQLEEGDALDLNGFEQASGEVEIAVPATFEAVFPTAPLAFYSNARVVQNDTPHLSVNGRTWSLPAVGSGYVDEVYRLLCLIVGLDTIARERSKYGFLEETKTSGEGGRIARRSGRDFAEIGQQPLPDRIEAYLDIPRELYEDDIPDLESTYHVADVGAGIRTLANAAHRLYGVRMAPHTDTGQSGSTEEPIPANSLFRESSDRLEPQSESASPGSTEPQKNIDWCRIKETDAYHQHLVSGGEAIALNAITLTPEAAMAAARPQPRDGSLRVATVCTDERMSEELSVTEGYDDRISDVDLDVVKGATKEELRDVLESPYDYLHYIGHASPDGLKCSDGWLDIRTLENTQVRVAVLNACRSLQQGLGLVERGALAVMATRERVENDAAVRLGKDLAFLLSTGLTVQASHSILKDNHDIADRYQALGSGIVNVAEEEIPQVCDIEDVGGGKYIASVSLPFRRRVALGGHYFLLGVTENHTPALLFGSGPFKYVADKQKLSANTLFGSMAFIYDGDLYTYEELAEKLGWPGPSER
jgi:hypothetical protein